MKIVKPSKMNRGKKNYCSVKCQALGYKEVPGPLEVIQRISNSKLGHSVSPETVRKILETRKKNHTNIIDWNNAEELRTWKREYARKWYKENPRSAKHGTIERRKKALEYYHKNKLLKPRKKHIRNDHDRELERKRYKANLEKARAKGRMMYWKHREKRLTDMKKWQKNNPHSSNAYPDIVREAMNRVRLRDKNTCQWYGCNLTHRETPIHVHHIFPRKDYPNLELEENYMICYCANHHGLWHRYKGDVPEELITSQLSKEVV